MGKPGQFFQDFPTKILYHYFNFRINTISAPERIRFRKEPYKILFLLSHMRSGSSLLTHILNSNPAIIGYGETHLNYTSARTFKELQFKIYWQLKNVRMNQQYLLDKILHNHKILDTSLLNLSNLYAIFLLREPERSLASILDIKPHWTAEKAGDYYCQRLSTLSQYARTINNRERSLFIRHEQLIDNSPVVFQALQDFLRTQAGFSEDYEVLKTTGKRGIGDSSVNIKAGRIIKQPRLLTNKVSQSLVDKARQSFIQCSAILAEYCQVVRF